MPESIRIWLCGGLRLELDGRPAALPGRQGRLATAYLVANRGRAIDRDELIDVLWPERPPADPRETLSALLSRLRRVLGAAVLSSGHPLALTLPHGAWVDLEVAREEDERAARALAAHDWAAAADAAERCERIVAPGFMTGDDAPWIEECAREVGALRERALEALAAAGARLGGARLVAAERAARALVAAAPFRESSHLHLMTALAAHGDTAEALRVYDDLRVRLRDELGAAPGPDLQALHLRLLTPEPPQQPQPAEERKLVTVLCAELADAERSADPEDLRTVLDAAHRRVSDAVQALGGRARAPAGGAVVAVFGALVAHEDDAERAARAALRLRRLGVASRVGIATGEAIVELPAGTVSGAVTATAARLQRSAAAGTILVDDPTFWATRGALEHDVGPEGFRVLKGRRAPAAPARPTPFVGRVHELAQLRALQAAAADERRPRLVTILGQAGVGKSRLLEQLHDARVLHGRCLPFGEGIAYWAPREQLWQAAGISLDDDAAAAAAKLTRLVAGLVPAAEVARISSALAAGAGIALPAGTLADASPETVAEEIKLAWARLAGALAAREPLLLAFEDLHWAEAPLLDLVEAILARAEGPLLLVATARPELASVRPGWGYRPRASQLFLDPLAPAESRALVAGLLPNADAGRRERVAAAAEGNPFFAEEIVRHGADPIPATVRAVLSARIDALGAAEKRVLQHAAVVGRAFWPAALGDPEPALLEALERRGFVTSRPSTLSDEPELWFAHGLTREVAYRSLPRAERARAHARVADWLERRAGDRRAEVADLLAHHLEAAAPEGEALRARAVQALLAAGDAARARLAIEPALRFSARALALARSDGERLQARELEAGSLHAAIRGDEAMEAYLAALALAERLGDAEARARLRGQAVLLCTRYSGAFATDRYKPAAVALVERGLAEVGEEGTTFETGALLVARAWGMYRWRAEERRDLARAERDARRAVAIGEAIGSSVLHAVALEALTWIAFESGLCRAAALGERHLRAAATLADRVEAHESMTVAAMCFAYAGRYEPARAAAAEATRQAAGLSPHRALHAGAAETFALLAPGRLAELCDANARVAEFALQEGERTCATGIVALAGLCVALHEAADPSAAEALALLERLAPPERPLGGWGRSVAEILRPVIGLEATRRRLQTVAGPHHTLGETARLRTQLPVAALSGDTSAARLAARARALARPACAPALAWLADWADAVALARAGRHAGALALAEPALERLAAHGEAYTAERLRADLLPLAGSPAPLVERTAARLAGMGAHASAAALLPSGSAHAGTGRIGD